MLRKFIIVTINLMQSISIEFPELREEDITAYYAQRRPFRETGVRI